LIPHRFGREEALRRVKKGLCYVGHNLGHLSIQEEVWINNHLQFRISALGQTASGSVGVADDHARLEVFLPWLLTRLIETLRPLIRREGTLMLEKVISSLPEKIYSALRRPSGELLLLHRFLLQEV
jgi:hypothetical protein